MKQKCIFCEWEPSEKDVEWGVCEECVDNCGLDVEKIKCTIIKKGERK